MSTTFYNNSGVSAVGNSFVGLVDTTNVAINPAKEDGNLATVASRLNANLSTIATEATLSALNTKVTTTANGIKVDNSAVTQPISGTVIADIKDSTGNALTSLAGSLNVNITGGSSTDEQHTVDSSGDLYTAGTTKGTVADARVVSSAPTLTAGQFSALNVSLAGRLIVDGSQVTQPISAASLPLPTGAATETTLAGIKTDTGKFTFTSTRLLVDGSGVTQPISGTVTSNIGTTNGLALDSTVSAMSAKLPATLGQHAMAASTSVAIALDQSTLPTNTAQWGGVATSLGQTTMASSVPVTLASNQSALAVSQSGTWTVQPGNTANTTPWLTTINQGGNSATVTASNALKVDGSAVTQPVSGTVTANIGTTNGLALDSSVTGLQVAQGSTTSGQKGDLVQGAVTTAAPSYTTAQTSPLSLTTAGALRTDSSATTQPVSGTVTANAGTGSFTVAQATAANLNATVTGTVTSNIGTTNGLALDATLTGGTQKTKLVDGGGTNVAAVSASNALKVDGSASTQPISAASLPLPTGASTEATLLAIDNKLPTTLGQTTMVNSLAVVIASNQSSVPVTIAGDSVTVSTNVAQWGSTSTSLGQKVMASSVPVTIASDQAAFPVSQSGTWTVQPGNTANTTPWLSTINQGGNSATVTASNALKVDGSAVTQPVSGTVTANQGTANATPWNENVAQWGGSATTLGQKAMASSVPVVIASDQTHFPVELQDGSGNNVASKSIYSSQRLAVTNTSFNTESCVGNQLFNFNVDAFNLPTAGTETVMILFKNPNGSGKTYSLRKMVACLDGTGAASTTFKFYANPTSSANGTAVTVTAANIGGGGTATATPFTSPTVSANGTRLMAWGAGAGADFGVFEFDFDGMIGLAANNTLLFTGIPSTNNTTVSITLFWAEL